MSFEENIYDYQKERREAIDAGNRALNSLKDAKRMLDSARNWGIWDMLGGGMLSGLMKRSRIHDAQSCMDKAKNDLQAFTKELGDINMSNQMNVEVNDFIGYMDILWDNLFVDWMMQDRINQARNEVDQTIYRVENVLRSI